MPKVIGAVVSGVSCRTIGIYPQNDEIRGLVVNVAIQHQTCSEAVFGEKGKRRISYRKDKIAMAEIKIDKDIPFRPAIRGKRDSKYPWMEMEIGDSFLFPASLKKSTACNNASFASKSHGKKFVVRKTPEGYRCWRVK